MVLLGGFLLDPKPRTNLFSSHLADVEHPRGVTAAHAGTAGSEEQDLQMLGCGSCGGARCLGSRFGALASWVDGFLRFLLIGRLGSLLFFFFCFFYFWSSNCLEKQGVLLNFAD